MLISRKTLISQQNKLGPSLVSIHPNGPRAQYGSQAHCPQNGPQKPTLFKRSKAHTKVAPRFLPSPVSPLFSGGCNFSGGFGAPISCSRWGVSFWRSFLVLLSSAAKPANCPYPRLVDFLSRLPSAYRGYLTFSTLCKRFDFWRFWFLCDCVVKNE